jgi:hypothetical protein
MINLTVNDKVILHLLDYVKYKTQSESPYEVTQQGIADNIGINLSHVPRSVKKLETLKLLFELQNHIQTHDDIKGSTSRRRKVYFLTDKGIRLGRKIRIGVENQRIRFIDKKGNAEMLRVGEVADKLKPEDRSNILTMFNFIVSEGNGEDFELNKWLERSQSSVPDIPAGLNVVKYPKMLDNVPASETFFGRDRELKVLGQGMDSDETRVIFIEGGKGIGKSVLVSKAIEEFYENKSILWSEAKGVTIWVDLVSEVSKLLSIANKKTLKKYLNTTNVHDIEPGRVVDILEQDIHLDSTILIIDSINEIDRGSMEIKSFLKFINLILERSTGPKILLVGRDLDLLIKKIGVKLLANQMLKVEVKGLDKGSSKKLLGRNGKRFQVDEFEGIYHHTGGNPLYLDLIGQLEISLAQDNYSAEERALLKYMKVVEMLGD